MAERKLQIAIYWGAGCGGCDVSVLDTNEFILDLAAIADIRFWPIAVDGKYADLERMAEEELDVSFYNGAVRNSENEHIAHVMRRKSKILVAFGSCSHIGGIPGLANEVTKEEIFRAAYLANPSLEPASHTVPQPRTSVDAGELEIPEFYRRVYALRQVVDVDYFLPGCPPAPDQVKAAILAIASGKLPPKGSVVGASDRALCGDCPRIKGEKRVREFHRPWEIIQDPELCLLEQGILCAGPATRSGCGVRCPNSGMPCRGCYGPPPNVADQGAKLLSAVASIVDDNDPAEIDRIVATIPDFLNYAYRFSLPTALLERSFR